MLGVKPSFPHLQGAGPHHTSSGTGLFNPSLPLATLQLQVMFISIDISHASCLFKIHLAQLQPPMDATGVPRHMILLPPRVVCTAGDLEQS